MNVWVVVDKLSVEEDGWETHLSSIIQGYVDAKYINARVEEITEDNIAKLEGHFRTKYITENDVFVFANSWTAMTIRIKHWSEVYNRPVKMIGFWSRGCYLNTDPLYRPKEDRNWRKVFERSSFRCLDKSFFIDDYHKEQFRIYVSKNVFPTRLNTCKFPMDYLTMTLADKALEYFKQDIIVYPWENQLALDEKIIYDFIRAFKNYKVIFAQEKSKMPREQILTQIAQSKIAFLPYLHPTIGQEIYECCILGTIPLVPDVEGLRHLVPDEFRYPVEWTSNILNYCMYAPKLTEMITSLMLNYEDHHRYTLEKQTQYLTKEYFDSEDILTEIFGK
jgi:hypothetical protein